MIQPILLHSNQVNFSAAGTPDYADLLGNIATAWATTENQKRGTVAAAGTLGNFRFEVIPAPDVGNSRAFTVMHNGVATAITGTISGTNTVVTYTASTITVAPGDSISIRHEATGTPTGASVIKGSIEFSPTDGTSTIYGGNTGLISSSAGTIRVDGPLFSSGGNNATSAVNDVMNVCPTQVLVDTIYLTPSAAPGGTSGITLYYNVNGVRQDGTGGTPNTSVSVTGVSTQGVRTGVGLTINAGDRVYLELVAAAGGSGLRQWSHASAITPTVAGRVMIGSVDVGANTADGTTRFTSPIDRDPAANASEGDLQLVNAGLTPIGISNFHVWHATTPGPGDTKQWTIRSGGSDTTVTCAMTDATFPVTSDTTHLALIAAGATFSVKAVNTGTHTASVIAYSMVIDAGESPIAVNDDDYETPCNTILEVDAPGVIENDSGVGLTATLVDNISPGGSLTFNSDGSFTFTPANNVDGIYTFTYRVTDAFSQVSNTATVTITVGTCDVHIDPVEPGEPEVRATGLIEMCFGGRPAADLPKVGYRTFMRKRP